MQPEGLEKASLRLSSTQNATLSFGRNEVMVKEEWHPVNHQDDVSCVSYRYRFHDIAQDPRYLQWNEMLFGYSAYNYADKSALH